MINVYKPYLPPKSLKYAHDALDSSWISSQGKYLELVKEKISDFLGIKYVILTNNGTAANHLMAKGLKFKYNWIKNILVPNNVYVAAWNGFLFDRGDYRLVNVDTDLDTWNIDLESYNIEKYRSDAVLVVHNLGNIVNVPNLRKDDPLKIFVEDNCEGFGGKYFKKYSGTESFISTISFYANKNVTSGEGGAVITNDQDVYEYMKTLWGQGQSSEKFIHVYMGYNYRMTNVQAAILLGQLEIYPEIKERKENIFYTYRNLLSNIDNVRLQKITENTEHSNWMFGIRILGNKDYKTTEHFFLKNGIEIRPFFYSIQRHNYLRGIWINMKNAKIL